LRAVQDLLDRGVPTEVSSEPRYTPLQAAVCNKHSDVALLLLKHGADPHHPNEKGWTAISHAVWYRMRELVEAFLAVGPPTTLRDAAGVGDLERVRRLVDAGAPINTPEGLFYPLYFALLGKHVEVARYLAARGAVPSTNLSILETAARWGVIEIVREQLDRHDPSSAAKHYAAAWEAATGDHAEIMSLFLDRSLVTTDRFDDLLGRACCCSSVAVIRLLVGRGADVNQRDAERTPLSLAREWSNDETVRVLLELGASSR
jgi:ankyrin repeat protein